MVPGRFPTTEPPPTHTFLYQDFHLKDISLLIMVHYTDIFLPRHFLTSTFFYQKMILLQASPYLDISLTRLFPGKIYPVIELVVRWEGGP